MKSHLSKRTLAGLATAVAVVIVVIAAAWLTVLRMDEIQSRVVHTHEVLAQLSDTLSDLQDVETGGRGFVITGQEIFLEPYQAALGRVDADVARLKFLVADNPTQSRRVQALEVPIAAKIAASRAHIAARQEKGFAAAQQLILTGEGKRVMDNVRAIVEELAAAERGLLAQHSREAQAMERRVYVAFVLAGGFIIGLLAAMGYLINRDLGERQRSAALLAGQIQVLEMIATGATLPVTLTALIRLIEGQSPSMLGSILLLDTDGVHVRHGAAPSLPAEYVAAIDGMPIGPCAGSCGTAAYRKAPVVVADIATDPLWAEYKAAALPHGLRACWSTPIFNEQRQVLGTFALYYRQPGLPEPEQHRLIDLATHIAAIAIGHHQANAAMRESEARYRQLFTASPDAVFVVDRTGRFLDCNETAVQRYGYSRAELLQMTARDLAASDLREQVATRVKEALATGGTFEWRHRRKDGSELPVEISAKPFAMGGQTLVLSSVRDITERKEAEAALRESERRLRSILDTMFVFVGLMDLDGQIVEVNEAPLAVAGLKRTDVLGRTVSESYWFSHSPAVQEQVRAALSRAAQGEVSRADYSIRVAGGQLITIDCTFAPLRDAAGRIAQIVGSAVEITARKQAEAALREAEARLRLSVAASNIGLWDWNLVTNDVYFSPEWKSQLGYTDAELPNRFEEWQSRLHPDDLEITAAKVQRFIEDPAAHYEVEFRMRHKDGSWRWIFTQAQIFRDAAGRHTRMLGCHIDITERKRAEAALRALATRLQAVREEERAGIARELHDELGQTLTALKFDLAWLDRKLVAAGTAAALHEKAVAMMQSVDTTIQMVRRISSELRPGVLDALGLVAAVEWQAQEFEKRTGIRCVAVLPAESPALDEARATALFRICQEALTNVARHAAAKRVVVTLAEHAGIVELKIADNGRGMADANVAGAKSLGLLGMRERAAAAGGTMELRSTEGKGTTVIVRVPRG